MNKIVNLQVRNDDLLCKHHKHKKLEFVCTKEDCNQRLLCTNCMINEHSIHFRWIQLLDEFFKPATQKELSELTQDVREDIKTILAKEDESTKQYTVKITQERDKVSSKLAEFRGKLNSELDKYELQVTEKVKHIKEDFRLSFEELVDILSKTKEGMPTEKRFDNLISFKRYIHDVITQENHHHENVVARKYDEILNKLNALSLIQFNETKNQEILHQLENPKLLIRFENEVDKFEFFKKIYRVPLSKQSYTAVKLTRTIATSHRKSIYKIVFFDDETRFATCSDDSCIMIWDITKDEPIKELMGHTDRIWNLIKLHDGNLVSSSSDKTLRLWDPYKGKCEKVLTGHTDFISAIVELPRLTLMTGSHDKTIKFWDLKLKESDACTHTVKQEGQGRIMTLIMLNPHEMACGSEKNINVYKIDDGFLEKTLTGHSSLVRDLFLMDDNKTLVSASDDKTIKIWNWFEGNCIKTLVGHTYSTNKVLMFNPGVLVSASDDHSIKFWNVDTGECVKTMTGHEGWIIFITIMEDGTLVSTGADKSIRFWSV